jgi:hypothetical protein
MALGGIKEASAFSISSGPAASIGVEGEMARVSMASLLEGAGLPVAAVPDSGSTDHVFVGQHGMIADLYSSGSLLSVTLDFRAAVTPRPTVANDVTLLDVFGAVSAGDAHMPLGELFHGGNNTDGSQPQPIGFAGEQRVPDDVHVPIAGQSALGGVATPLAFASMDNFATAGAFAFGHHEIGTFLGGDGLPAPIGEQHFIA